MGFKALGHPHPGALHTVGLTSRGGRLSEPSDLRTSEVRRPAIYDTKELRVFQHSSASRGIGCRACRLPSPDELLRYSTRQWC